MHLQGKKYKKDDHLVECDVCGFVYRNSVMRKRWDGLVVCPDDFETRQPQDFVRGRKERDLQGPQRSDDSEGEGDSVDTSSIPQGTFDNSL